MPERVILETHADHEDFLGYSHGDGAFAAWCQAVDSLSTHFLSMSFFEIEDHEMTTNAYQQGMKPEEFLGNCLISEAVCNYGFESIEALVANNVMWGQEY